MFGPPFDVYDTTRQQQLQLQLQLPLQYNYDYDDNYNDNYNYNYKYITINSITLHYIALRYTTREDTTPITFHYAYNHHYSYNNERTSLDYSNTTTLNIQLQQQLQL